tara:strand:- start:622 stop:909 length:288 start_codon:yes stop_codon:yes gene_type:complete
MNTNVKLLNTLLSKYETSLSELENKQRSLKSVLRGLTPLEKQDKVCESGLYTTQGGINRSTWLTKEIEDTQSRIIQALEFIITLKTLILKYDTSC